VQNCVDLGGRRIIKKKKDFVAEATKIGELYSSIAKEVFKPIESATKTFTAAE
jgi:hypothetical protein